ncbi:ATP-binding protein [Phenylobacterium sp.]|uniref:ATP-binding protein n=1 Tax=Phenylobacterium sp. TaxID=1871053 RepID=UPI0025EBAB1C|nr:ATP-binding protein [Phenylobacterium sp.]
MAHSPWHAEGRRLAVLVAAYAAAAAYSLLLAGATQNLPVIWTANAVVVAGLLILSKRAALWLLVCCSLVHVGVQIWINRNVGFVVAVTLLDSLQALATAALIRRLRIPVRIRRMRHLFALTLAAGLFTALTSPIVSSLSLTAGGWNAWSGWRGWMISNAFGMALALPIILVLADARHRQGFPARRAEAAAGLAVIAATTWAVFTTTAPLEVLLFAPALLAVFRGGPRAAAWLVMVSLAVAIPTVLARTGLDPAHAMAPLRFAQMFHFVLYGVCMTSALALSRQMRLQALLVRRTAAARAAQARAQAANQAKSDFLATMSHEIRTPLNSVLGFAALVADDPSLSDENRRRLDLVGRAGRSLAELVNDLLDFSKVEAGRLELNLAPAEPAVILRDAAAIVAPTATAKGLSLSVSVKGDEAAVFRLDEARLRQVLLNLLANAVKFTAEGGVEARLSVGEGGDLVFEVADTGIGIAPEVQSRLFQRFTQADSSISRSYGGTGLGLAISRALVNQMGGEIGVESAPGQGACFRILLSAEKAVRREAKAPAPVAPKASAARVLLVDDHPMNRELGQALLTLAGFEVATAEDGAQAVEAAAAGGFDAVLMDVHMPRMDGLAATRAIRALGGAAGRVPIVALTADVRTDQVTQCREAGMDDYVAKPIHREELIAAVSRAVTAAPAPPEVRTA